jgi:hypothetical protein
MPIPDPAMPAASPDVTEALAQARDVGKLAAALATKKKARR